MLPSLNKVIIIIIIIHLPVFSVRCLFVFLVCRFMPEVFNLFIFMIPIICRLTMSKQAASILKYGYIVPQTCYF